MHVRHLALASLLIPSLARAQPAPSPPSAPSATSQTPAPALVATAPSAAAAAEPAGTLSSTSSAPAHSAEAFLRTDAEPSAGRIGFEVALLPAGSLIAGARNVRSSADTGVAYAIGAVGQYAVNRFVTVDIAPRVVFNVQGKDAPDAATEIDLRARVALGGNVGRSARLYMSLQPGFSLLVLPTGNPAPSPSGPTLGVGSGVAFSIAPRTTMTLELGYQLGFQSMSFNAVDYDLRTNYFHAAGGLLFDL